MTQEEIIELAKQADVWVAGQEPYQSQLEAFAKLIAEKEREACAKLCEDLDVEDWQNRTWDIGTLDCAKAIRERQA